MSSHLGLAARTLALDLATGEVIRDLGAAGIDGMVLKGPAMARHLYGDTPAARDYGDIDLLVAPGDFDAAGLVLAGLGFEDRLAGIRASEAARLHGRPWHRDGVADIAVDLHRGFHNVADRSAWWQLLGRHRDVLVIEGQPVTIPDRVGCAVIAALHASKATSLGKPLEDLRRALRLFDDEVWRPAAELAGAVGAGAAFAAALCRETAGAELAARLGLTVTDPVAWFMATSDRRGAGSLSLVLAADSRAARAQRLRDAAFPSAAVFVGSWPVAARGRTGLAVARAGRLCVIVVRLPGVLLAWYGSSRALRRRGDGPPARGRAATRADRARPGRAETFVTTSWWTLRTWWRIHRRLARGPGRPGAPGDVPTAAGPAAPVSAAVPVSAAAAPPLTGAGYSARAARLVLACCGSTCLETALVRQARAAGAGVAIDVVVGVTPPAAGFRAHAWLDGDQIDPDYLELCRCPAMAAGAARPRRAI